MNLVNKSKMAILMAGDVIALYCSLFLALLIRYGGSFYEQFADNHVVPFTIIFLLWVVIFYIAGLYDLRRLRNKLEFTKLLWLTLVVNFIIAALFFYLIPTFAITPKTNLFIFVGVFALVQFLWRQWFNNLIQSREAPNKVLLVDGSSKTIDNVLRENPDWAHQLGYDIVRRLEEEEIRGDVEKLRREILAAGINLVVVPRHLKSNEKFARMLYELLNSGVEIYDVPKFYEMIGRKVPLAELEESWFVEQVGELRRFYDPLKRGWEFVAALLIGVILLPLELLIALVIKLASRGPVIYRQARVGQHGKEFTLYKFRTMPLDAESKGVQWSTPGDTRPTLLGRFLRHTHLDELPQLLNILKGELSFIGPRPERPEFVKVLKEKIPYYEIRLLVKPGVTGWAQIHHHKDATTEDVIEKLQFDIYYIKNRSPILDLAIVLKTIKTLFVTPR